MVLSGLILLPMLALPTLFILRKDFQIKFFYTFVSFIHFGFSMGLLTKYGYLYETPILANRIILSPSLGLNYSISATALDLLLCNLISLFYLLFGAVNLLKDVKKSSVILMVSHSLALLAIFSDNLPLSSLAVFSLLLLTTVHKKGKGALRSERSNVLLYFGFILLAAVSLVFGILYESIHGVTDLDLDSLSKMRTPFVKGSFYSTQFNLALIFGLGFTSYLLFSLKSWAESFFRGGNFNSFIVTVVSFYVAIVMLKPLFPEVYSVYMPWAESSKFYLLILFAAMTVGAVFLEFFGAFKKRGNHV